MDTNASPWQDISKSEDHLSSSHNCLCSFWESMTFRENTTLPMPYLLSRSLRSFLKYYILLPKVSLRKKKTALTDFSLIILIIITSSLKPFVTFWDNAGALSFGMHFSNDANVHIIYSKLCCPFPPACKKSIQTTGASHWENLHDFLCKCVLVYARRLWWVQTGWRG